MSAVRLLHLAAGLGLIAATGSLNAQGSLLRRKQLGVTPRFERITFSSTKPGDGDDGTPIATIEQLSIPFGVAFPLARGWSADVAAAYTSGRVEYDNGATVTLSGISDVRLRVSGKLVGDALILTLGANAPSGAASLDAEELTAVRVLAAPAFGLQMPSVGFGPAGTVGLVGSRLLGQWVGAVGVAYEYRGKFSPVAALQAGAQPDFDPGNSTRLSLGLEGFLGDSRIGLQAGADLFSDDRLTVGGASAQTIKLGPILSLESTLSFATSRIRDGRLSGAVQRRASFTRNGEAVDGSDGVYMNAGLEGGLALGRSTDLHLAAAVLVHTGLDVDNTLMTAKANNAGVQLGLRVRGTGGTFEPFVRAGTGSVDPGSGSSSFSTLSAGLTLILRF